MPRKMVLAAVLMVCLVASALAKDKFLTPGPVRLTDDGNKWAEKTLKKMSLEQKIGQMLMIWAYAEFVNINSPDYIRLRDTMRKYHIGSFGLTVKTDGLFLLKNQPYEAAMVVNQLQRESELPLIFAADFEYGLNMRLNGVTTFPLTMAFGADGRPEDAENFGRLAGREARAIGVEWNFYPVADVNSNPANPIINTRSFSEDPQQVGALAAAYIRGAHESGLLTTAKHFPGHGDTATDSHLGLAVVGGDLERLNRIELPPFQAEINAGVDAVMVAHVTVPALEPDPKKVASTSRAITTDLLKNKMGFQGLVVTDALDMNGLMRLYSGESTNPSGAAAVAAVKAGNDMILIPRDIDGAYNGLLRAVRSGELSEAQINRSVRKILRAKASVGLHKARLVDIEELKKTIADPEAVAFGEKVAQAAITLVRDNGQALPLKRAARGTSGAALTYQTEGEQPHSGVVAVVFSDDVRSQAGRVFERELRARVRDADIYFVDPRIAGPMADTIMRAVAGAQVVVAPVYVVATSGKLVKQGNEWKNSVSLTDATAELMRRILQQAGARTVVLAMGNPYVAADFPEVQNYLCAFSNTTVSESAAVKALFGEIPIRGRLPVTIPAVAQRGSGIDRPPQVANTGGKRNASAKTVAAP